MRRVTYGRACRFDDRSNQPAINHPSCRIWTLRLQLDLICKSVVLRTKNLGLFIAPSRTLWSPVACLNRAGRMSKRFQLTPEQIALSEERKAKKQKLQAQAQVLPSDKTEERLLARPWLNLDNTTPANGIRVKLLTWNLLAQCLVRESR